MSISLDQVARILHAREVLDGSDARIVELANRLNPLGIPNFTRLVTDWQIDGPNVVANIEDHWAGGGDEWSFSFPTWLLSTETAD